MLLHPKLLDELFIPQPVATHTVIKRLLQDISATSIMKLDDYSMSKLWDLMTMIFKWQISVATNQNIFDITRRHLRSVAILMPQYFSKDIFENSQKKFDILTQKFTDDDYNCLCSALIIWFSEYHAKISVLMRLGLQKKDGTFSLPYTINANILKKLGENIYKYDNSKKTEDEYENYSLDTGEINCLLASIENVFNTSNVIKLKLPFEFVNEKNENKMLEIDTKTEYKNITAIIKNKNKSNDLTYTANILKSPQEDLLEMLNE